jgi:hypothetical protein
MNVSRRTVPIVNWISSISSNCWKLRNGIEFEGLRFEARFGNRSRIIVPLNPVDPKQSCQKVHFEIKNLG